MRQSRVETGHLRSIQVPATLVSLAYRNMSNDELWKHHALLALDFAAYAHEMQLLQRLNECQIKMKTCKWLDRPTNLSTPLFHDGMKIEGSRRIEATLWDDPIVAMTARLERLSAWSSAYDSNVYLDTRLALVAIGEVLSHADFNATCEQKKPLGASWQVEFIYTPSTTTDDIPACLSTRERLNVLQDDMANSWRLARIPRPPSIDSTLNELPSGINPKVACESVDGRTDEPKEEGEKDEKKENEQEKKKDDVEIDWSFREQKIQSIYPTLDQVSLVSLGTFTRHLKSWGVLLCKHLVV